MKKGPILLANSSEQNLCEKICSYRGAKLDENRTSTPTNSTIMQSIGAVCRLVVISPAVSGGFSDNRRSLTAGGEGGGARQVIGRWSEKRGICGQSRYQVQWRDETSRTVRPRIDRGPD